MASFTAFVDGTIPTAAQWNTALSNIFDAFNAHTHDGAQGEPSSITLASTHITLDNGATDGGAVNFNGSSASNMKSTADGASLNSTGFTAVNIPQIKALYSSNSAQTIGGSPTIFNFEDLEVDSHTAVTVGAAWKFTAPVAGVYLVQFCFTSDTYNTLADHSFEAWVYKGGSVYKRLLFWKADAANSSEDRAFTGCALVNMAATNYIDIRLQTDSSSVQNTTVSADNWVTIVKVSD